ncbi:MAG: cupin domain-containing protein [Gammaproteobacteria bacterium]
MNTRYEVGLERDERTGALFADSLPITREEMLGNVWRFADMPRTSRAFIDTAIPGHERVLMGALGSGAEDEALRPQVERAQNYHVDYVLAQPGNGAALHSHDSEESFICLSGRWKIGWGTHGEESVELAYLDGIVVPPGVMRSFENVSGGEAMLLTILGGHSPGPVAWSSAIRADLGRTAR